MWYKRVAKVYEDVCGAVKDDDSDDETRRLALEESGSLLVAENEEALDGILSPGLVYNLVKMRLELLHLEGQEWTMPAFLQSFLCQRDAAAADQDANAADPDSDVADTDAEDIATPEPRGKQDRGGHVWRAAITAGNNALFAEGGIMYGAEIRVREAGKGAKRSVVIADDLRHLKVPTYGTEYVGLEVRLKYHSDPSQSCEVDFD